MAVDIECSRRLFTVEDDYHWIAEAGVPEDWVVNCDAESIEVHRAPTADGSARSSG